MKNSEPKPETAPLKTIKAVASSPIYATFDVVKLEGKDVVVGSIGFRDQFGMERMARTAGEKGVLNLGKHVLAIFGGLVDITEPDEETKAKLAAELSDGAVEVKGEILNAYKNKEANDQAQATD